MLEAKLFGNKNNLKILFLGAHSDDIEIGCGGTILKFIKELAKAQIRWIVFSGNEIRAAEAQQSASTFLNEVKSKKIDVYDFRESYFPFIGADLKDCFEKLKKEFNPDIIFTHYAKDAHQDHKLISKLTWNTFRDHFIFEYEIPKYDGDLSTPNLYVNLDDLIIRKKINYICKIFKSQKKKSWFSEETFRSISRIRGIESNSPDKYAESFYCHKILL